MGDITAVILARLKAIALGEAGQLRKAEEELKALEVAENYGIILAEITSTREVDVYVRQLSSLVLKQYVHCHWSEEGEHFCEPLVTSQAKQIIKRLLLSSLSSEESKIRSTVAYAIAAIATWEWPEEWPDFVDIILQGIQSGNCYLTNGSMHVLEEFSNDISDNQLPRIAPVLFQQLFEIISREVYDLGTRCRAVVVFETLTTLVLVVSDVYPEVKEFLVRWIKQYLTVFGALLSTYSNLEDLKAFPLIKEILSALTQLLSAFPKHLSSEMSSVLQPAWSILVASVRPYLNNCVNDVREVPGLEGVLFVLFDFISTLVEVKKLQKILLPALPQLLYHLISYMLITETQLISWDDEPEKFLEDENDDLYSISLRMSALDLVNSVSSSSKLSSPSMEALIVAINRHLEEAAVSKQQGLVHWWKVHESCMLVMPVVAKGVASGSVQFDVHRVMTDLAIPDMFAGVHPLLTGRCLWLSGKLVGHLSQEVFRRCLSGCVTGIGRDQHMLVRICAVMALHDFCCGLEEGLNLVEMVPYADGLLRGVVDLVKMDNDGIRIQVLEALAVLIPVAKETVSQECHHIVQLCAQVFIKCCNDPGVLSVLDEVFSSLARQPSCQEAILSDFASLAVKVLRPISETGVATGMVAAILDIWTNVVLNFPSPLPLATVEVVFPSVVSAVLKVDDSAILQSGGDCLKAYLIRGVEQLGAWSTTMGENGLLLSVKIILHLLDPSLSEFSCSFLGPLVIVLIKQVGSVLGDHLETIVRSVLSKLHTVQSLTVTQSLLTVLFYLVHTQLESTLDFLEQVPDISGRSALEYVLILWVSKHDGFFGKWDTRLSSVGLSHMLLHYVETGDKRLVAIETEVEEVASESRGIMTRSMKKKEKVQYTRVLLPQKLLKLLIDDYQIAVESATGVAAGGDEWDDDSDGDQDSDDDDDLYSALVGDDIGALCEMESEQNEFADDPIMLMDWKSHLEEVLLKCCQSDKFRDLLPSLTAKEVQILSNISSKH